MSPEFRVRKTMPHPSESRDRLLLLLLVELWALNVADLALTRYSLWLGFATESNNVMDFFLRAGTVPALAFKVGIVTVGALLLLAPPRLQGGDRRGGAAGGSARRRRRLSGALGAEPALSAGHLAPRAPSPRCRGAHAIHWRLDDGCHRRSEEVTQWFE